MTGAVLLPRQDLAPDLVMAGAPVSSGAQWYPAGFAANWLGGQCAVLVPGMIVDKDVLSGATGVLHFRVKTRVVAIERVWTLRLRGAVGTVATIKAPTSTGTALVVPIDPSRQRTPIVYREILGSQASAVIDLTIEIAAAGGDIIIDSISCFELARPLLAENGTDNGTNIQSLRPRERVFSNGFVSATGVLGGLLSADPRRSGLYHWSAPTIYPITTTAAYADILTLAAPILARKLNNGATTADVSWAAYAMVSSGSGDVRLTASSSGATGSVNVTATSFAWTATQTLTVDCEDMTAADGRQGASWEDIMPSFRANGGVTLSLAAISIFDEET